MKIDRPIISLFSGAMGLDLGLELAGYRTAVAIEKNVVAVETIRENRGDDFPIFDETVETVEVDDVLDFAGLTMGETFVLTGGPCCQSFSTVGKRQSLSDPRRGTLFREFKRFVSEAQPRFFIMENVRGILSAAVKHRPLDRRGPGFPPLLPEEQLGSALEVIRRELQELNYYVVFGQVNCADYGVPQKRHRVVFIGSRDGENISIPPPTHAENPSNNLLPWVTLREAIGNLEGPHEYLSFADERKTLLRLLYEGQNWRDLPKRLQRKALGAAADTWGGRSGFCRRLSWDTPAPTLTTDPIGRATTLCHPTRLRPLSVEECARLQQFPDAWKFCGLTSQKYAQIGNAVPLGLGDAIGKMLKKVSNATDKNGLPADAKARLGKVIPATSDFEKWLKNRKRTQLHPPWKRKNKSPEAAKNWLARIAA